MGGSSLRVSRGLCFNRKTKTILTQISLITLIVNSVFICVITINKNRHPPLEEYVGVALLSCFRFCLIRASSYRPKRKSDTTFFQNAAILFKAINRK